VYKFKIKNPTPVVTFLLAIIIFIFTLILKSNILAILRLPLIITSSLVADTKAVFTYKFILNENLRLKREIDSLKKDTAIIGELRLQNERLKRLLSLRESLQFNTVSASVIAKDPNNWLNVVIIDKGRRQGIKPGDAVITELGLAGRAVDVSDDTSKVILINDLNSSVAAIIQRTREEGLVCGTLLGKVIMRYLEKDSGISAGDVVLTSGLTQNYPSGLESVEQEQGGLSKSCVIKPAVNLGGLEEVLVIIRR